MTSATKGCIIHSILSKKLAAEDGATSAWAFAYRELQKLSYAKDFEECTDTDVREQVYSYVVGDEDVPFYI